MMALQVEEQDFVARVQPPVKLFRADSFERELPDEPEPARDTFREIDDRGRRYETAQNGAHSY